MSTTARAATSVLVREPTFVFVNGSWSWIVAQ
jgi:hypothetical protein